MSFIRDIVKRTLLGRPSKAHYKFVLKKWEGVFDLSQSSQVLETKRFTSIVQPIVLDLPEPRRVMAFAPHIDDEIYGAGGTLYKLGQAPGSALKTVYFTSPPPGSEDFVNVKQECARVSEYLRQETFFFDNPIGNIPADADILRRLAEQVESFAPDAIFLPFLLDDHDDHRRLSQLLYECLPQLTVRPEIWGYQVYTTVIPNVVVDVTDILETKDAITHIYKTVRGNRNWPHYVKAMSALNCRYIPGGEEKYGEGFFVVPMEEYMELCAMYFKDDKAVYANQTYWRTGR